MQGWGGTGFIATGLLSVAPDGSVWVNGSDDFGCDGVAHYDGTTWTQCLHSLCVHDIDIGPDGNAWVRANDYGHMRPAEDVQTYVITPETTVATES